MSAKGRGAAAEAEEETSRLLAAAFVNRSALRHTEVNDETIQILSLIGRRGSGKTSLMNSYIDDAWVDVPARRQLLRPGMIGTIMNLARQVIAKSLVAGTLRLQDWPEPVRDAIEAMVQPLDPHNISPDVISVLNEFGVFATLIPSKSCTLADDEGFFNVRTVLVDEFPASLFTDTTYIPTSREIRLCRASSVWLIEGRCRTARVRILDCPGLNVGFQGQLNLHDYVLEFPGRTTPVFVVSLHALPQRMRVEASLFHRVSELCVERGISRLALVLTHVDAEKASLEGGQSLEIRLKDVANEIVSPGGPSLVIGVCSALDERSASVVMSSLAVEQSLFRVDESNLPVFCDDGIVPHVDLSLSRHKARPIMWTRSVYSGNAKWTAAHYGLLPPQQRAIVRALLLVAKRKESPLHTVPSVVLIHIASFLVDIYSPGI